MKPFQGESLNNSSLDVGAGRVDLLNYGVRGVRRAVRPAARLFDRNMLVKNWSDQ